MDQDQEYDNKYTKVTLKNIFIVLLGGKSWGSKLCKFVGTWLSFVKTRFSSQRNFVIFLWNCFTPVDLTQKCSISPYLHLDTVCAVCLAATHTQIFYARVWNIFTRLNLPSIFSAKFEYKICKTTHIHTWLTHE